MPECDIKLPYVKASLQEGPQGMSQWQLAVKFKHLKQTKFMFASCLESNATNILNASPVMI